MKGDKKKSHKFKKGNVPWNKGISTHCADSNEACVDSSDVSDPPSTQIKANRTVRMTEEEYYLVTNKSRDGTSRTMPDCEGSTSSTGSTRLLRPARTPSSDLKTDRKAQDTDGMRLVDNDKMVESWNTAYRLHRQEPYWKWQTVTPWNTEDEIECSCSWANETIYWYPEMWSSQSSFKCFPAEKCQFFCNDGRESFISNSQD